ncbi:MAG: hypothetical protein GY827_00860 [Cytophagales bacterium]|nr:hypothetical protein [Cytophagales bacterium]
MIELFKYSFAYINLIPTCLLLLTLIYWFCTILGALDLGFLDFDLEPDGEIDVTMDVEISGPNVEVDSETGSIPVGYSILGFFNIGKIPFMLFFTLLSTPMWFISIVGNYYLGIENFVLSLALLAGNFFVSMLIAKFISTPFVYIFKKMAENEEDSFTPIGKVCTAKYTIDSSSYSQAIVIGKNGADHIITVKTYEGKEIKKNEHGLVIEHDEENNFYTVEPHQKL